MTASLIASWSRHCSTLRPDIDAFLVDVFQVVDGGEEVSMRQSGPTTLELRVGAECTTIGQEGARAHLRSACARLCVLFTREDASPPLYGGELESTAELRGVRCTAHLSFDNDTRRDIHFTLRRT